MRTPESWLRQISNLRLQHSALAKQSRWLEAQTVRDKIVKCWNALHACNERLLKIKRSPIKDKVWRFAVIETTENVICTRHRNKRAALLSLAQRESRENLLGGKFEIIELNYQP